MSRPPYMKMLIQHREGLQSVRHTSPHRSRPVAQGQDEVDAQIAELRKWFRIEQEVTP